MFGVFSGPSRWSLTWRK